MAVSTGKPMTEAEKSKNRVAARQAKLLRQKEQRGGRDLTDEESTLVRVLNLAVNQCRVEIGRIQSGKSPNDSVCNGAAQIVAAIGRKS